MSNTTATDKLQLLAELLAAQGIETDLPTIPHRPHAEPAPLAYGQELLWLLDRATPGVTAYNGALARRIRGPLDVPALARALEALVARHAALRTTYHATEHGGIQRVEPPRPVGLERIDLRHIPVDDREAAAQIRMRALAAVPFDLSRDQLLRPALLTMAEHDHILFLLTHHIAVDGWSVQVIVRDLAALYDTQRGVAGPPAPLAIQYPDYAAWQRETLQGEALERRLAYWRAQMRGPLPPLDLPTDRPRPAVQSFEGGLTRATLAATLVERLRRVAQAHDATLYMVLLAGYQALLHRYTGQEDIVVGSAMNGRTRRETEDLVGYFANTLPMRVSLAGDPTFAELLGRVRETVLGAFDHQDVPLETLALELQRGGQLSHAPLFNVVFTMHDTLDDATPLGSALTSTQPIEHGTVKFDLTVLLGEQRDGVHLQVEYRTDLFEPATVERLLDHFAVLLDSAVAQPSCPVSRLPLLTSAERHALVATRAPALPPATVTVPELIARQARRVPDRLAVVAGGVTITYAELERRSSQLAHYLRGVGVGPDVPVGLCLDRSVELVVAMLAIQKAGGAYVPLMPDLPAVRLASQLAESGAPIVVTRSAHLDRLPPRVTAVCLDRDAASLAVQPSTAPAAGLRPEHLAYVLFTSGSTGTPKGVAVTHRNIVGYSVALARELGLELEKGESLHFATVSTLAADLGNTAIYPALLSGGTLHLIASDVTTDAAAFGEYVARHPIDLLKITPNHLRALLAGPRGPAILPRRYLVLGGEACPWDLVDQVRAASHCRLFNHYGPTETTVGCCVFPIDVSAELVRAAAPSPATVPIGYPLPNATVHVLDAQGQPVPSGVPGELYVGGHGVARGYLNRPELTAERFVTDAFRGGDARLYRTGDRVRRLPGGDLEFLGRADDQVKLRGYRVELGEIAVALTRAPGVREAFVMLHQDGMDPLLTAYVVSNGALDEAAMRAAAAAALPDYMVPQAFVALERLPLNANGKVDRRALPTPSAALPAAAAEPPRTPTEQSIAAAWAEVLKRDAVGRDENFFDLGGHSLIAIRILGRLSRSFGIRLPLRALFEAPTVAGLAEIILREQGKAAPSVTTGNGA